MAFQYYISGSEDEVNKKVKEALERNPEYKVVREPKKVSDSGFIRPAKWVAVVGIKEEKK